MWCSYHIILQCTTKNLSRQSFIFSAVWLKSQQSTLFTFSKQHCRCIKVTTTKGINAYLFLNQCFKFTWIQGNKAFNLPAIHPSEQYKYTWNMVEGIKFKYASMSPLILFLAINWSTMTMTMVFLSRAGGKVPCSHNPAALLTFLVPEQLLHVANFKPAAGCLCLSNIYGFFFLWKCIFWKPRITES